MRVSVARASSDLPLTRRKRGDSGRRGRKRRRRRRGSEERATSHRQPSVGMTAWKRRKGMRGGI